jgi:hypothetical protein
VSEELRSQIAAIIRQDMAAEAQAGFALLQRFPNSETASVPAYFARLARPDQDSLLDALAHYSTLKWSHEIVLEKRAHPVLGPYLAKQPLYPKRDWYGERPKKSQLKKSITEALIAAGYSRQKRDGTSPSSVVEFSHPDPSVKARLIVSFDPGLMRQMDFGFREWLHPDLSRHFELQNPREFIPAIGWLAYDHLWHGAGTNNPVCWDLIAEVNVEETGRLLVEVLERLTQLAARVNAHLSSPANEVRSTE